MHLLEIQKIFQQTPSHQSILYKHKKFRRLEKLVSRKDAKNIISRNI